MCAPTVAEMACAAPSSRLEATRVVEPAAGRLRAGAPAVAIRTELSLRTWGPIADELSWIGQCRGFRVDSPENGRIGFVDEVRLGSSSEHVGALAVTAGLYCRRLLIVPLEEVAAVFPEARTIILRASAQVLATEVARPDSVGAVVSD